MPTYRVTGEDGTVYEVDGPEGVTRQQVIAKIKNDLSEQGIKDRRAAYLERMNRFDDIEYERGPEDTTLIGNIGRGLGAGFVNTLENSALGLATLLDEGAELTARDAIKAVADSIRPELANPEEVSAKLAQGVGSILGFAPALLTGPAAPYATAAMALSGGAGEASERARAAGATQEQINKAALLGTIPGAFDIIPLARLSKKFAPGLVDDIVNKFGKPEIDGIGSRIRRAFTTGGIEGAQETAQGIAQNLIERGYNPDAELLKGAGEEGLIGAGSGVIIQGLLDAFVGRGARKGGPQEEQGELFPDDDLGAAPAAAPTTASVQGELFPDTDLGATPERPDDRQLDLFDTPVAQPEGEQLDFNAELDRQQEALRQERAREREALAAIERGDEAALAQPDLFPEDAATARTVAEETAALRRMGDQEVAPEATPATPTRDPRQTDLVDEVRTAEFLEAEENTLREAEAQEAAVRDESALETIGGQLDTQQGQETTQRRGEVLDSVLTDLGTASRANTAQRFSSALAAAGIANTAPTAAERRAIDSATDVVAATRTQRDDVPPAPPALTRKEARAEAAAQRRTADQAGAEQRRNRRILTEEDLAWGPKKIKDLKGQDVGNPGPARDTLQKQLETLQKNAEGLKQPRAIEANQQKQQKAKELLEEQPLTASATSDIAVTPATEQVTQQEGQVTEGAQDVEQLELFGDPISAVSLDRATGRTGDVAPVPQAVPVDADTTGPAAPAAARVGAVADNLGRSIGRAGDELASLERAEPATKPKKRTAKKSTAKKTAAKLPPKKETPKKIEVKKPAAKKPAAKKPAAKKVETQKPFETRVDEDGNTVTIVPEGTSGKKKRTPSPKSKQVDAPEGTTVTSGDAAFRQSQATSVRRYVAFTDADVAKVDELVRSKRTRAEERRETAKDRDRSGAKKYFGRKDDPIEALDEIVYDLVYGPPDGSYRLKGGDKGFGTGAAYTEAEQRHFKGRGKPSAKEAMRWVRDNLDPKTVKDMTDLFAVEVTKAKGKQYNETKQDIDVTTAFGGTRRSAMSDAFLEADEKQVKSYQVKSYVDAQLAENIEELSEINVGDAAIEAGIDIPDISSTEYLGANQVVGLDLPAHPVINNLLRAGKLREALQTLAITSPSSRVSQVARKLAQRLGDTEVEVVENLTDEAGMPVAGLFDPKTNTIKIDAATGINPHTILHETTHALTSATLANKSHPVTKQLQKLFDDLREQGALDSFYGSQSLDEFVAEAFGNPEFQTELANIKPDGSPISALQRFFNTIGNFVRRMLGMQTKPLGSALNQADTFIEAMLAPAPQSRGAGALYLKSAADVMGGLDKIAKAFPKLSPAYRRRFVNQVYEFFSGASPAKRVARTALLYSAPLQALTDVAQRYGIKSAFKLHTTIQGMVGAQARAETRVDGTMNSMQKWLKIATDVQVESFNNLVYDSTTQQVDPFLTTEQAQKKYRNNAEKLAAWKAMRKDVRVVGLGGKNTYIELRESYRQQFNELQKVIASRIDGLKDADGNPLAKEAKEKLKTDIFDKIFAKGRIEPYFPLTRRGDKWLEYNTKVTDAQSNTTTEPVYMAFETAYERKQFMESLKGNKDVDQKSIRPYENIKAAINGAQGSAPPSSFINETMKLLAGVDQDVRDEFTQLFLNALPESSFAKSMVSRANEGKGRLGFDKNAESAFRYKAYNLASQIERMRYSNDIDNVMTELREEAEAHGKKNPDDQPVTNATFDELAQRASFAKNPPADKLASSLNRVAFVGTIGFNVSSAVVNLSQIPLMFVPMLTGDYATTSNPGAAFKAVGNASKIVMGSGKSRKIGTMLGREADATGMPSIDNYYQEIQDSDGNVTLKIRDDLNLDAAKRKELEDLMPLVEMAAAQGQLNRSIFYDTLGVELSGREKGLWDYTNAASAFMFHQVERFNRQVAMVSVYQLELASLREKGGMTEAAMQEAAANKAIYKAQEMNGGAFLATAPRIAQTGIGRVAMMYKTFGVQMYYTIMKTGKAAFSDADPEVRKRAMVSLAGVMCSSALMAGVQGLPMVGAAFAIANMFLDDDEDDAETITRKFLGEGFYKGGINAATGMDVASRFGLGNLLFRLNPYAQDQSAVEIAAQAIGGPALSVVSQFARGVGDAADGNLQRGVETMLPSAFRNIAKTMRYSEMFGEGAIKSRRGDVIYDDISTGELTGQLLGFAPAGYTLIQEKNMGSKRIDRAVNKNRTQTLRELYIALRMGDYDGVIQGVEEIQKFNGSNPNFAIFGKTVGKSMRQHAKTSATMMNGITISPKMRGVIQQHRADYWGEPDTNLLRLIDFD